MARHRLPLAPIAGTVTPREWVIVLGGWLLLALASAGPIAAGLASRGVTVRVEDLRMAQGLDWLLWAALLPVVFRVLDRLPLRPGVWPRHLAGWVGAGVGFGAAHAVISYPLIHLLARLLRVAPAAVAAPELRLASLIRDDISNFFMAVLAYVALQFVHRARRERHQAAETERLLREARLHALSLQLQPHFLFNTLNGIAALIRTDPKGGEQMLIRLSDLLRLTLATESGGQLPLGEELRRLELYLSLQRMRMGSRLTTRLEVPAALEGALVPAMFLQPLVENALSHGIDSRRGPGTVTVTARAEGEMLELRVEDDGVGVPASGPTREGIGLSNSRARLDALHPGRNAFRIEPGPAGGTRVTARFPLVTAAAATPSDRGAA